jgi:hypothetical protein
MVRRGKAAKTRCMAQLHLIKREGRIVQGATPEPFSLLLLGSGILVSWEQFAADCEPAGIFSQPLT